MERRRRVPRQSAGWPGTYSIEDDPRGGGHDCVVLDVSILGVGLELYGAAPRDLIGRRLVVQVQPPVGAAVSIRLLGEVRNTGPGRGGGVRVGLEFTGLTETERSILDTLELMQVAW